MTPIYSNTDSIQNRVCIIGEADPFLTRLIRRMAEKSGFKTQYGQTGEAVLDLVFREKPDLIVLEPDLPGKVRGWEAVQTLQRDAETRQIAVILFSWLKKDDAQVLVGYEIPYLTKPDLNYEDFAAALKLAGLATRSDQTHKID
jgi:DNA-binding response OmpR family regulator